MHQRERTVVVGAGLAGLACAFDLARAGRDVVVLEALPRAGGVAGTLPRDGFLFELGPHTVQSSSSAFRALCADLGLADRLIATSSELATRWLWFGGKLVALPRSPIELATTPLLSTASKLRIATEVLRGFVPPEDSKREPTFEEFLAERIGSEATRLFAGAFVRGIYAAEVDELGARSAFPRLWNMAVKHGGLVRGLAFGRNTNSGKRVLPGPRVESSSLLSFPGGLQEIVAALELELGMRVRKRCAVERIDRLGRGWCLTLADGTGVSADRIVLAVPAPIAAKLLANACAGRVDVDSLHGIRHARVSVVHLGFARGVTLPRGFGYLVPPDAEARGSVAPRALGTIFASNLFQDRTPPGGSSCASFYRGSDVEELDDARLVGLACEDLRLALGMTERPRATTHHIQRWNDVIPRYEPGHDRRMRALLDDLSANEPSISLAGSYTGGVSVDAVIARGRAVAREVVLREDRS